MTTETKDKITYVFQAPARAAFINADKAKAVGKKSSAKGKEQYSATLLLTPDSPDFLGIKTMAAKAAKARWPGRNLAELRKPWADGEAEAARAKANGKDGSMFLGQVVFKTRSEFPPSLAVRDANGTIRPLTGNQIATEGAAKFYHGCYVAVKVTFETYASEAEGGIGASSGVKAYLDEIVWMKDGPKIGGGNVAETFKHFAGQVTVENPMDNTAEGEW